MKLRTTMTRANGVRSLTTAALLILCPIFALHAYADDLAQQIRAYKEKLAIYTMARAAYEQEAAPYWATINEKRKRRIARQHGGERPSASDYVLNQPPLYTGPPKPIDPEKPHADAEYVPVVADFLEQARKHFEFVPDRPISDEAYAQAYAKAALAAGLTSEQCVKIYAFESGGAGGYAVQAGLEYDRPGARAITTALGYNQLLTTNSIELLAEAGDTIVATLRDKAQSADDVRRERLLEKVAILKKMIAFSRSVPDRWAAHSRLAATDKGLGVHALILDVDIGPLLQVHKLLTSVIYAKRKGYDAPLTAAELEMMNLTGDGNGFDMVSMPDDLRKKVPTSNFFQRGGYERNPVAIRNNTVAKLLAATDAKMEEEAQLSGAKSLRLAFQRTE
ncbi:hypothetical protein [Hyphomicrobium sp.]|uniref:hypothetical protein n=1 Tax=Hyphomicrobium sp. TaxID=82 RepID=UPI0025C1DD6B|nr:hypothetical protein [Hyphomicrobium sp.]